MNFHTCKGFFYFLVINFVLLSCSKKVALYCESGFDKVITSISVEEFNRKKLSLSVIKDSNLYLNPVIGIAFTSEIYKVHCKQIRLNITTINSVNGKITDTTFVVKLTNKPNTFLLNLYSNYNYIDNKSFITLDRLKRGVFFR